MTRHVLVTIVLTLSLVGCAADERQTEICRQVVTALVEDAADIVALPVERDGSVLAPDTAEHGGRRRRQHLPIGI